METWQENEIKKEYLNGYRRARQREKRILEQIQQLRMDKMFPCLQNDGLPRGSRQSDMSDYAAKLDELIEELKEERLKCAEEQEKIKKSILYVKNDEEQEVLEWRYLLNKSWEEIAKTMNYSRRYILKIHGRALKNLKIQKEDTK